MKKSIIGNTILFLAVILVIMMGCFEAVKIKDSLNESDMFYLAQIAPSLGYLLIGASLGVMMCTITEYRISGAAYIVLIVVLLLLSLMPLFYYITLIPRLMWESSYVFQIALGMNLTLGLINKIKSEKRL